jgi:hypothetical protein
MSAVVRSYILMANEGLGLATAIAYPVGIVVAAALFALFLIKFVFKKTNVLQEA